MNAAGLFVSQGARRCGVTFGERRTNIDFVATGPSVIAHNLLNGNRGGMLIRECCHVLKPGGIIRIAIPDLEQITVNYLRYLNESVANVPGQGKYE